MGFGITISTFDRSTELLGHERVSTGMPPGDPIWRILFSRLATTLSHDSLAVSRSLDVVRNVAREQKALPSRELLLDEFRSPMLGAEVRQSHRGTFKLPEPKLAGVFQPMPVIA